jgi:hypothetical protein
MDVNEAPFFQLSETLARSRDETCAATCATLSPGAAVFSANIMASDPDTLWTPTVDSSKAWQNLTFDLVGGNDAGFFSIATVLSQQGSFAAGARILLTAAGAAKTALDFEVTPSYSLQLRVRDNLGLYATGTLALSINNRNEPPVFSNAFTPQPGVNQALPAFFVWENATNTATVGAAPRPRPASLDPEDSLLLAGGLAGGLAVSITGGDSAGVFGIVASTGQIFVADRTQLVFETAQAYSLTISLRDSGAPEGSSSARTTTTTASVTVGHVNKAPSIHLVSLHLSRQRERGRRHRR